MKSRMLHQPHIKRFSNKIKNSNYDCSTQDIYRSSPFRFDARCYFTTQRASVFECTVLVRRGYQTQTVVGRNVVV